MSRFWGYSKRPKNWHKLLKEELTDEELNEAVILMFFTGISHFLNFTSAAAGYVGVTALAGIITAPIGMALGGVTIGAAIISSGLTWEK